MLPVNVGLFRNQAAVLTKAALEMLGLPGGGVRGPLLPASDAERRRLTEDLAAGGVKLDHSHFDAPGRPDDQRDGRKGNGSKENITSGAAQ
jgi:hypothetical protein